MQRKPFPNAYVMRSAFHEALDNVQGQRPVTALRRMIFNALRKPIQPPSWRRGPARRPRK